MHAIEKKLKAIPEGSTNKGTSSKKPSSSRSWPAFKNPRIVRVPSSSGNKDRHSKVSTIRGLRDRRIRLSVQTAIQLYELQDALGLGQPSKVIDWLLEASKDDIDRLPPLPIMPYGFTHLHQELHTNASQENSCFLAKHSGNKMDINTSYDHCNMMPTLKFWDVEASMRGKKALNLATLQENQVGHENNYTGQVSAQNLFPMSQYPYLPAALLKNAGMPNTSPYYHWESPSLSLYQFSNHNENPNASSPHALALQPPLAFPSGNQLFFCPPLFFANPAESNRRQIIDHLQFLSSSSQQVLPSSLNVNPWLIHSENNAGNSEKYSSGS